jgi:glycosyltransferase involved in cell wall biosynthesis
MTLLAGQVEAPDGVVAGRGLEAAKSPVWFLPTASATSGSIELSVVVPFFNPGPAVLRATIDEIFDCLSKAGVRFEVVAVSDGSTDGSERTLDELLSLRPEIRCVVLAQNCGKGRAVREGMAVARGEYVAFIDGDGDIPPGLLVEFLTRARASDPDVVVGSKRHADSEVVYPRARRAYSFGYQRLIRVLFGLRIRDSQTGIKLLRQDVAQSVIPLMREDRFAFDIEMLALAHRLGFAAIEEAPVQIRRRLTSTIRVRTVGSMLLDTAAVFWRLRLRRSYRAAKEIAPSPTPAVELRRTSLATETA